MRPRAVAKLHAETTGGEEGLFAACTAGHLADSTGFALPATLKDGFSGTGGGARGAGAKSQLVGA